ncbi:MAG TPA: hypothetical protein VK832_10810 [Burkholderiaceae bacterium]|jgi:hypothetical protein|nr:hypothetical protein [Burkholderiaceae bacterium]
MKLRLPRSWMNPATGPILLADLQFNMSTCLICHAVAISTVERPNIIMLDVKALRRELERESDP